MRRLLPLLALSVVTLSAPAFAQPGREGPNPVGEKGPLDTEKVKLVYVYGDDPCPASTADEIMICAKLPDADRYRIPKELRSDPLAPQNQSWANRARTLETAGASGINSCSPVGAGGWTGCFAKLARDMKEERKTMLDSATWADAVAKAREKRLANLDAESEAVEKQAKEEEAGASAQQQAEAAARARLEAQDKAKQDAAGPKAN
ncbi:MAG: hypothetical protein J7494_14340 [Sphingobium sp.]|nr:hypothetical protein [Sphingobium sp.]